MNTDQRSQYDAELIRKIQSGNKEAFAQLYRTHFFDLCEFAYRYVKIPSVCEELVQDLFLNIWMMKEQWEPEGSIRPYLYKSIKNGALDYLKHRKVERRYLDWRKMEQELDSKQRSLSLHQEERELAEAIDDAIAQLPDRRQEIFLLSREDGLTYREIADVLDISVKTVETQMGRSLKTLRKLLSDYLPGLVFLYEQLQSWM